MKRDRERELNDYLNLPYRLEVTPLGKEDGGGFCARYPELGEAAAHGDGPTIEAAIREAEAAKRLVLEVKLEYGDAIPLPEAMREYSGKFNVRVPKSLHRDLAEQAQREGVSLNQLIVSLLSRNINSLRH